jgi:hypothetical protein
VFLGTYIQNARVSNAKVSNVKVNNAFMGGRWKDGVEDEEWLGME